MEHNHKTVQLNAAGKLARIFLNSKLTVLGIIIALLLGALALMFTPRTYNPEIVVPVMNIFVSRPGSNVHEVLNQIVRPLEGWMRAIPGVDHTYGTANDDSAMVTVRFKVNQNEETSLVKVYNQINSNLDKLPSGASAPFIQSISLYDVPLLTMTLSSKTKNASELREISIKLLEQLRSVPQVGKSWVMGASKKALRVWIDPGKLAQYGISFQQIKQRLQNNNIGFDAGKLESTSKSIPLRVHAQLQNVEDIKQIFIATYKSKPVYLRDIARVESAPEENDLRSFYASGTELDPAVTIAIARQKGSNGVVVANELLARLSQLREQLIPADVAIHITRNYGADANEAVNTLLEHLGISIIAIVCILLLFLGWREALIVTTSIPIILLIVLGIGWILGQTINRITLFALILSLGLLVDDSIVVIENIHRHMIHHAKHNFARLVIFAANEIGKPTIIATLTVILALIPMAFVGGMMGPFMQPIPFNAPIAMITSLIVAYTVVPYLAYRWLHDKASNIARNQTTTEIRQNSLLQRIYIRLFVPLLVSKHKRHLFYILILSMLILVMLQPAWQFIRSSGSDGPVSMAGVELKMLPDDNVNTFLIELKGQNGETLGTTKQVADAVSLLLANNRNVTDYQLYLGQSAPEDFAAMVRGDSLQSGSHYGQIRVNLTNKKLRKIGSHQIVQSFDADLANVRSQFPSFQIKIFETPPGPPVRSQMEAALFGNNYETLREMAVNISQTFYPTIFGMINVDNSVGNNYPSYLIVIDRAKAVMAGLDPIQLSEEIRGLFSGLKVGSLHTDDRREPEDIILRLPAPSRQNLGALEKLMLINQKKELVPLTRIATIQISNKEKSIYTRDQSPVVYVTGEMLHSSPVNAVTSLTKKLNEFKWPDGSNVKVGNLGFNEAQPNAIENNQFLWLGEMRLTLDVFRDLGSAFIVAILLIYFLLTGFYRSFFTPVIIMGAIPLTLIGVFPGHWLMQQPFTATSMIGVIALAGIVVRNSLLLIDFIIDRQKHGAALKEAVVEAGSARLLPIMLTALAIILGSSVMVSDPVFGGLAISLIFGTFVSTTLTLFVIPLAYYGWKRDRHK